MEFLANFFTEYGDLLVKGTIDTIYMSGVATFMAYVFGLPLGIILVISSEGHILPNSKLNFILGGIINTLRSIPFIILLIAVIPLTRLIVGKAIGPTASIVPLVIGATPFVARMVETSLREVERGIIEAAQSMGATPWQIIRKILIPETLPSLVLGATITTITLISYSAIVGVVGGGGLGDLAVRYGYYRYQEDVMLTTIILLIIMVQVVQSFGDFISRKINTK